MSCCVFKCARLELLTPVKIREGVDEISITIIEATTEPPKYILVAIHCVAAEHGGLITKKERKKVHR